MARSAPIVFTIFFFVLLLLANGRTCLSKSQLFSGMCWINANCATICTLEKFSGGHCRGFRRRC
ncbi:hypothetical protein Lal_00017447 [Lupinus albus]|nr:hypothetical protein Lal_00017447 [Lupinus albus]